MKKITFAIVFSVLAMAVGAQNIFTISGTVLDSKTGHPLPYCNCYLKHSYTGASTSTQGHFPIKLKSQLLPDTIVIQSIGYESAEFPLVRKNSELGTIILEPRDTELKDVTVKAKATTWNKTLKTVFDSCFYKAYPTPNVATTYYKQICNYKVGKKNYNNEEIVEVALDVLFPQKHNRRRNRDWIIFSNCSSSDEHFFVTGLRKTKNGKIDLHPENSYNIYGIFDCNDFSRMLNENIYFYKNGTFEKAVAKADLTLAKIDTIDGNTVYTLNGIIRKHNSITELTISFDSKHNTIYSYELVESTDTKNGQEVYKIKFNYRIIDGYAVPLYFYYIITEEDIVNDTTFTISDEALFSDTRPATDSINLSGKEASGKNSFDFQGIKYDEDFWNNYTIIE